MADEKIDTARTEESPEMEDEEFRAKVKRLLEAKPVHKTAEKPEKEISEK